MKQTFLLLFPIWEKWGLILDHYLMNVTQLANLACPQILSSIIWILKLGVVWSALIHLSYNLPQAKNKIKPWYIPFVPHLGFSPGPHVVTALARLSQAVCRIVWELSWIEKAQDGRGSKDQFFYFSFLLFFIF